jgi:hypothetical protein
MPYTGYHAVLHMTTRPELHSFYIRGAHMEIHCQNSGSSLHATHRSDRYMQVISSTYSIYCTFLWRLELGQFCESVTWLTCGCACLQLLPYIDRISLLPRPDYCPSSHRISQNFNTTLFSPRPIKVPTWSLLNPATSLTSPLSNNRKGSPSTPLLRSVGIGSIFGT